MPGKSTTVLPLSTQSYIIVQSHNQVYRFSTRQKWGIALLFFMIPAYCLYIYLVSKEISVFIVLILFVILIAAAFRKILKSKSYFLAVVDNGVLIIDFDLDGKNDKPERHRIMVPARNITGYDTQSFLKGNISHVSIRFKENNQTISTRPVLVEALTKEELNKLLSYLDAQVSHARRLTE